MLANVIVYLRAIVRYFQYCLGFILKKNYSTYRYENWIFIYDKTQSTTAMRFVKKKPENQKRMRAERSIVGNDGATSTEYAYVTNNLLFLLSLARERNRLSPRDCKIFSMSSREN